MSNDLNACSFIGRLGKDPETRYTSSSSAVVSFSLAVGWKSKEREGVEWVSVVAFDKLGEICAEYLRKGSQIFVSGRLRTEKYQDKNGETRYSTKIVAERMQMLGSKRESEVAPQAAAPDEPRHTPRAPVVPVPDSFADDDIPF